MKTQTKTAPNADSLLTNILEDINCSADSLKQGLADLTARPEEMGPEYTHMYQQIVERIGWLSEIAIAHVYGETGTAKDAEKWFLSPRLRDQIEKTGK